MRRETVSLISLFLFKRPLSKKTKITLELWRSNYPRQRRWAGIPIGPDNYSGMKDNILGRCSSSPVWTTKASCSHGVSQWMRTEADRPLCLSWQREEKERQAGAYCSGTSTSLGPG